MQTKKVHKKISCKKQKIYLVQRVIMMWNWQKCKLKTLLAPTQSGQAGFFCQLGSHQKKIFLVWNQQTLNFTRNKKLSLKWLTVFVETASGENGLQASKVLKICIEIDGTSTEKQRTNSIISCFQGSTKKNYQKN